jgi:DNA uptake protein ComE-like DNA-binding protein/predicted regulator of Ras-like GTPase activity (Roadblock/LC7/MglB family)
MRLPFFRSPKAAPVKAVFAPPSPAPSTKLQLAETQLISNEAGAQGPVERTATATVDRPRVPANNGQTIPLSLSSISQQLPANFIAALAPQSAARITINIPADWVLPQLAKGRVTISLADLLPLLPENLAGRPFPTGNSQHAIVLPLADIVSALPVDLLQHQNQTEVDLDSPEFTQFPKLLDDSAESPVVEKPWEVTKPTAVEEAATAAEPRASDVAPRSEETPSPRQAYAPPIEEETSLPRTLAGKMAKPISSPEARPTQSRASQTQPTGNEITVSLRSLVAVMPDHVFICPRTDLWRRIDLDSRIPLPSDLVVPQLKIARVRLPLAVAVGLMPRSILASPLPQIAEETIPIALQEIVSQVPANLFTTESKQSDLHELDFGDSSIPTPFAEKNFAPATVEIRASETARSETAPVSSQPTPAPEPIEVSSGAIEDEGASIFAEKSTAIEPAPEELTETPEEPVTAQPPLPVETPVVAAEDEELVSVPEPAFESTAEAVPTEAETTEPPAPVEPQFVEAAAQSPEPAPIAAEESTGSEAPESVEPSDVTEADSFVETPATTASTDTPDETTEPAAPEIVHEAQVPSPNEGLSSEQILANLNNCAVADLARIEGVGPVLAQRIIEFRNSRGGFQSLDELREVHGISRRVLRALGGTERRGLNRMLGVEHNDELTLQEVVRLASQLQGVAGCILAMSDGVFLTGQLPPHLDRETISVFAPQLFRKVGRYMKELRAGQVTRLSVFTDEQPISILRADDIFLIVVHDNRHFSKALLRRCERISQELARLCRQRAVV